MLAGTHDFYNDHELGVNENEFEATLNDASIGLLPGNGSGLPGASWLQQF